MAKSRQILNTIDTESKLEKQRAALLPKSGPSADYLERMEEEKYKTESTKTHERYRRKQKNTETAMSLEHLIRPAKKKEKKPGTYFYGPLKKLAEDFGDISVMLKYMTLGQNEKYSQDGNRLLNRAGQVVYDEKTQECFE